MPVLDLNGIRVFRPGRRALLTTAFVGLVASVLGSCRDSTSPPVMLDLRGTVRREGVVMPGARVILQDRHSSYEPGYTIGSATTDAGGRYEMRARAKRPGYEAGCEYLSLFIEGYEYFTGPSAPLRCSSAPQTIDLEALGAFDVDAREAASMRSTPPPSRAVLMPPADSGERR